MRPFQVEILLPPVEGKSGRKYKLRLPVDYTFRTSIRPLRRIETPFILMTKTGMVTGKKKYAWDGSTGAADTLNSIEASCRHDILCQLLRMGLLPIRELKPANRLYVATCREKGMVAIRAKLRRLGLRVGSKRAVRKGKAK